MIDSLRVEREAAGVQLRDWTLRLRARLRAIVNRTYCVLMGGHCRLLHFSRDRIALRCIGCGDTTPGWQVGPTSRRGPSK